MRRMHAATVTAAIAAVVAVGVPTAASAAPSPKPTPTSTAGLRPTVPTAPTAKGGVTAQAPDGRVWVWGDAFWDNNGLWCGWTGNHKYWEKAWSELYGSPGTCKTRSHSFDNVASSMYNNGYPGSYDDVEFFKHSGSSTYPSMCLGNGDYWGNLNLGIEKFNDGTNANDQISAHFWVNSC